MKAHRFHLVIRSKKDLYYWEKFKKKCKDDGRSKTVKILELIRKYVDGEIK